MMNARKKAFFTGLLLLVSPIQGFSAGNPEEKQPVVINPSNFKEEVITTPPPIKDNTLLTDKTESMKKLDLKKIILAIDEADDYIFGIFPENNKNKIETIDNDILIPLGKVTIYDITHTKKVAKVDLERGEHIFANNIDGVNGLMFSFHLTQKSKYLITPEIYVKTDKNIDDSYVFFIKKRSFVK